MTACPVPSNVLDKGTAAPVTALAVGEGVGWLLTWVAWLLNAEICCQVRCYKDQANPKLWKTCAQKMKKHGETNTYPTKCLVAVPKPKLQNNTEQQCTANNLPSSPHNRVHKPSPIMYPYVFEKVTAASASAFAPGAGTSWFVSWAIDHCEFFFP